MNILHVIDSLQRGGAERMLVDLANRTAADGHGVEVCVTRSGTALKGELHALPLHVLGRTSRIDVRAFHTFKAIVDRMSSPVLHVHGRSSLAFVSAALVLTGRRAPVVFHDHYGAIEIDRSVPLWFRAVAGRRITAYVGVSVKLGRWALRAGVPEARVRVIQNAIDTNRIASAVPRPIRQEWNIPEDVLIGVVVGNLRQEKGLDTLIGAIDRSKHGREATIVVVGRDADPKYGDRCRALVRDLGLERAVRFVGEQADVPGILLSADFGLMPSCSEAGPLILIEMIVARLPFVSTTVGSVSRELRASGFPGFVPPDTEEHFAAELDRLLELDEADRRCRGEAGDLLAELGLDIDAAMASWYDVYETAIGDAACGY